MFLLKFLYRADMPPKGIDPLQISKIFNLRLKFMCSNFPNALF